jgi:hypothetical protein
MKRSKFTDSQIMDAVKRVEAGMAFQICVVSWASARRRFANGGPSTAVWMCP